MTIADQLAAGIPRLRRFARALSGSQTIGDKWVAAALPNLAEGGVPRDDADAEIALFRALCSLAEGARVSPSTIEGVPVWEANTTTRLGALAPRERIVFLLRSLEGFDVHATAAIVNADSAEVEALMQKASEQIAEQLAARVLIIEDEPLIAMDLERIVEGLGHKISAIAHTHSQALAAVASDRPGLVLADVHLADGSSGIDAVEDILVNCPVPTVFITAFPHLLLTGERTEPTFLIAKPYDPDAVKAMISQVLFFGTALPQGQAA